MTYERLYGYYWGLSTGLLIGAGVYEHWSWFLVAAIPMVLNWYCGHDPGT